MSDEQVYAQGGSYRPTKRAADPSSPVPAPEEGDLSGRGGTQWWAYDTIVKAYPDAAVTSTPRAALSALIAEFARLRSQVERMGGDREEIRRALEDCGIGGIFDIFDSPADAITQMAAYIQEREPGWQGRSSDNSGEDTKPEGAS